MARLNGGSAGGSGDISGDGVAEAIAYFSGAKAIVGTADLLWNGAAMILPPETDDAIVVPQRTTPESTGSQFYIKAGDALGTDQVGGILHLQAGKSTGAGYTEIHFDITDPSASGDTLNPLSRAGGVSYDGIFCDRHFIFFSNSVQYPQIFPDSQYSGDADGNNLTVKGGDAGTGGAGDHNGGPLILAGGKSVGAGYGEIRFMMTDPNTGGGAGFQNPEYQIANFGYDGLLIEKDLFFRAGSGDRKVVVDPQYGSDADGTLLKLIGGDAGTGGADHNAGNLLLQSGISTGTGIGQIAFQISPAGSTGNTQNGYTQVLTLGENTLFDKHNVQISDYIGYPTIESVGHPTGTGNNGNLLVAKAGDAVSGATDASGGQMRIQAGRSTGTGTSEVAIYTSRPSASGSSYNANALPVRIDYRNLYMVSNDNSNAFVAEIYRGRLSGGSTAPISNNDVLGAVLFRGNVNNTSQPLAQIQARYMGDGTTRSAQLELTASDSSGSLQNALYLDENKATFFEKKRTYVLKGQSVGAVSSELTTNASGKILTLDSSSYLIRVSCIGRDIASTDGIWWDTTFRVDRATGAASCLQKNGGLGIAGNSDASYALSTIDLTVDTATDGRIIIRPLGVAGKTTNWKAMVDVVTTEG